MATTQRKRTSKAPGSAGSAPKGRAAEKRPVRREVGGVVCLALALCVFISFFTADGLLMVIFPKVLKGLFGVGYYLLVPALILSGIVLLTHRGRPVACRVCAALALPCLIGSVVHMLACGEDLTPGKMLGQLWDSGYLLKSGGVVSGGVAEGFLTVLGKPASVAVFCLVIVILLMVSLRLSPAGIAAWWRDRERYDEEDYGSAPAPREEKPREEKPAGRKARGRKVPRASIDIPLDSERTRPPVDLPDTSFFRAKDSSLPTPADVAAAADGDAPPWEETAAGDGPAPSAEPAAEPAPAVPAAAPESAPERPRRKSGADVEAAAAEVSEEIGSALEGKKESYEFPPVTLLEQNGGENCMEAGAELRSNARRLSETLKSFGVEAAAGDVIRGPAVTRYEFTLEQGVKLAKVTNLADDIALALGVSGVRIAPIPDKLSVVGVEVPNRAVSPVLIRDVIESRAFTGHKSPVAFAVGRDIGNRDVVGDIARLPHVLIAGTTGSGKSVCTNSLIVSILYKSSPEDARFIMVDPKMVELAPYNGIPHLLIPVVTDPKKAAGALQWAVYEMMKRYRTFSELGVKKLEEYNAVAARREDLPHMPSVIVVIDELADLMLVAAREVEESICRVAQMGRAAGMHLVIATQRPSADVITGLMKANIPSRIAFAVASSLESRIILDNSGAEKLVGRGDMLYAPLGSGKPIRVQGCFITPEEIERVVDFVKSSGEAQYSDEVMEKIEESLREKEKKGAAAEPQEAAGDGDELLPAAVDVILETGQASVSMLQRRLKLGYSRAARLVDQMEERGFVGPFEGSKPRQILITKEKWQEMKLGAPAAAPEDGDAGEDGPGR